MSLLQQYRIETTLPMSLQSLSDGELIKEFVDNRNERAFDTLLRRHYQRLYKRFLGKIRNEATAHDLSQTLWMRVLSHLTDYRDDQKFEHYLNTIASNLIKDHWRGDRSGAEISLYEEGEDDVGEAAAIDQVAGSEIDEERHFINREAINALVHDVIPGLPCDQRLVYLLRHEAELWDDGQPFEWQHLAELNGMDVDEVSTLFTAARDKLVQNMNGTKKHEPLDCIENLVFLMWTQTSRVDKKSRLTEQYFSDLLNIPVNTFKTRYRASVKALGEGMQQWR